MGSSVPCQLAHLRRVGRWAYRHHASPTVKESFFVAGIRTIQVRTQVIKDNGAFDRRCLDPAKLCTEVVEAVDLFGNTTVAPGVG
jgi:hypothetical protein